jgi:hypothetical protein
MTSQIKRIDFDKSFCAFIDILGFESLVMSKSEESVKRLEFYYWLIDDLQKKLKIIESKSKIKVMAISDSIILTYKMGSNQHENIERLRHFLLAINLFQYGLATQNIWSRGGVSIGNVSFNPKENFIVGDGYIKSYKLEQVAKYPRTIIDTSLIKELDFKTSQELVEAVNNEVNDGVNFSNWNTDIIYDWKKNRSINVELIKDTPLFLDYLSPIFRDNKSSARITYFLRDNLNSNLKHFPKYKWIIDYLMSVADKCHYGDDELPLYQEIFDTLSEY